METLTKDFSIVNKLGLHARSAAKLVQLSEQFDATIRLFRDRDEADGKSILDILTLACPRGSRIRVEVSGPDASIALKEIGDLIQSGFGED